MDKRKREFMERYRPYKRHIDYLQSRLDTIGKNTAWRDDPAELSQRIKRMQDRVNPIKRELLECIKGVPNVDVRATLELRYIHCLSVEETAQQQGIVQGTVIRRVNVGMDYITLPADYGPSE